MSLLSAAKKRPRSPEPYHTDQQVVAASPTVDGDAAPSMGVGVDHSYYGPSVTNDNNGSRKSYYTIEWPSPDVAIVTTCSLPPKEDVVVSVVGNCSTTLQHSAVVCVQGRGQLELIQCSSNSNHGDDNDTTGMPCVEVYGYQLIPDRPVSFESPSWSSSVTVPLSWGSVVRISSTSLVGKDSATPTTTSTTVEPSFTIVDATHETARPTVVSESWKKAADAIVEDFGVQRKKPSTQTTASFFSNDNDDSSDENGTSKPTDGFRIAVAGAKGVGKSTYVGYCLNRLLSTGWCDTVLVLDADPGQPEYAPPGMLQLTRVQRPCFVPPHCNYHDSDQNISDDHVVLAHYFGSITSSTDPTYYLECIASLLREAVAESSGINKTTPVLINLDGWIKGLGFEILQALLQDTLFPTHVVSLCGDSSSRQLDLTACCAAMSSVTLHDCWAFHSRQNSGPTPASSNNLPAHALRSVRMISYLLPELTNVTTKQQRVVDEARETANDRFDLKVSWQGVDDPDCEIARRLAAQHPYAISMDAIRWKVPADIVDPKLQLNALNGSIVGLCIDNSNNNNMADDGEDEAASTPLQCLGLGLVRSIDHVNRLLYVLTPVPLHDTTVDLIFLGENVHLPLECTLNGVISEVFVHQCFDGRDMLDIVGATPIKSRNNIARRGLGGG